MDVFYKANVTNGLFHDQWSMEDGKPHGGEFFPPLNEITHTILFSNNIFSFYVFKEHFTIGATADSGYEYLLKQWIQNGDLKARQQCKQKSPKKKAAFFLHVFFFPLNQPFPKNLDIKSATGIINNLIYQTPTRGLLYAGDISRGSLDHRLEHLSCYLPGILALGAHILPDTDTTTTTTTEEEEEEILPPKQKQIHKWAAHGLAYTCAVSYADQKSGLGPDQMRMMGVGRRWVDVVEEWELGGGGGNGGGDRRGGGVVPPGMGEPEPEKDSGKRDYFSPYPNAYYLRPEVSNNFLFFSLSLFTDLFFFFGEIDCRKYFHHVEDDWRCEMERTWIWDIPSY